jgi:hypothetical protein
MRIFVSHASEDKDIANRIADKLRSHGNEVFFDQDSLPPGLEYDDKIKNAFKATDLFIFLISPDSVRPGKYTLVEVGYAERKWKLRDGHILPVLIRPTEFGSIPPYRTSVTILKPQGPVDVEVLSAVDDLGRRPNAKFRYLSIVAIVLLVIAATAAGIWIIYQRPIRAEIRSAKWGNCLEAPQKSVEENGASAQLTPCSGSHLQKWTVKADGTIWNDASGRCLDADRITLKDDSTIAMLWGCSGAPNQIWSNGGKTRQIVSKAANKCLEPENGSQVSLMECHEGLSQQWKLVRDDD